MKKKIVAMVALVSIVSSLVMGCGSFRAQNEYITITQYKGLKIQEVEPAEIKDADVEREIESYKEVYSTLHEITDRPAQEGDIVKIDLKGFLNGEAFEGGEQEGAETVLGMSESMGGFDDGIIGHNPGDEFSIDVTFPDPYPMRPELAGETAVFEIKLHTISEKEYPELDDEFAKTVSKTAETMDELKAEIKERQIESAEAAAQSTRVKAVLEALQENIEVKKLPEDEIEEIKAGMREQYEQWAGMYGMEFAEFLEAHVQTDEAGLDELLQEDAEKEVLEEIAIALIAEKEKLVPSDEEYQERYEEIVEQYDYESVESLLEIETEEVLQNIIIEERVGDFLVEHAEEVSAEELEKEAEQAEEETQEQDNADAEKESDSSSEKEGDSSSEKESDSSSEKENDSSSEEESDSSSEEEE